MNKTPQSTKVLIQRLRRVAKWLDTMSEILHLADEPNALERDAMRARANTCWQAAGRLEDLDAPRALNEELKARIGATNVGQRARSRVGA